MLVSRLNDFDYSGLGPSQTALFPFYLNDDFGGGIGITNNSAVVLRFDGGDNVVTSVYDVTFWWWRQHCHCCGQ